MAEEVIGGDTTQDDEEQDTSALIGTPVPVFNPGADSSLVDLFREELRQLSEAEFVLIPIVGYDRIGLQVRYHLPERGREIANIGQKVMREVKDAYSRNLFMAMDIMIRLCDGLYVEPPGADEPFVLDPQEMGVPMQFDERLADFMSMNGQVHSAREVLLRLFGGNEMAILAHANKLQRWLQNTSADLDAEVWELGE